ncbi:hypothetical protein BDP27DRAFT_1397990 [Rhodocollybia butyracea]|uniref:Uncharacterized protein n=1 Tax=Rhodocollybia butyracea TaxID=206335 RepID=A0A9P5QAS3_9AGAR|nr:hypothetical protein BDP27DRAFT_1397990 [Rhodocollybia butyracea]
MLRHNRSAELQDMNAGIAKLQAREASKTKSSALTRAYTNASDVRSLAQNPNVQQGYSVIKNTMSNFVPYSRKLVAVLNEAAKVHVFISAVVVPFAAAIELENTRRENDGRVIALTETMCDMMFTFSQLNNIPKDHVAKDRLSLDERLKNRMDQIALKIDQCSKTCDTFYQKKGYIKFINSYSWRDKFTAFAEEFTALKANIRDDLQLYIGVGVANVQETLVLVQNDMKQLMEMVFSNLVPLSERKLALHIQSRYGGREAVLNNDAAIQELAMESFDEFDSDDSKALGSNKPSALAIRMELEQDVDQAIANNTDFDKKFEVMKLQISEVKETVKHQSDRVIEEIKKELHDGPHERILDKDMYKIWKEMGWKRSIKARHLVMGLHAYFGDEGEHTDEEGDNAIKETAVANRLLNLGSSGEDKWALQYIDILYLQPLLEAFDDDISGFVTITEVNEFTASRPQDWNIRTWIAYWAIGFEMQSHWYFRRIRNLLSIIQATSVEILPENRKTISLFFRCRPMRFVEDLLAGLRHTDKFEDIDWEEDIVFSKFRDYISSNETNMKSKLRELEYNIGDKTALQAVTGQGRLEKHLLAVVYLLLERAAQIVNHGCKFTLSLHELKTIRRSLATVGQTFCQRVDRFSAAVRLQNLNHTEQVAKVFYGMFAYVRERDLAKMNEYWKLPPSSDKLLKEKELHLSEKDTFQLYYPSPQCPATLAPRLGPLPVAPSTESGRALLGEWRRIHCDASSDNERWSTSFNITEVSERLDHEAKIAGFGSDSYGPFTILGKANLSTRGLVFRLKYTEDMVWQYEGTFDDKCVEIEGTCHPLSVDIPDPSSPSIPSIPIVTSGPSESSDYGGHLHLTHTNRYRALWKIACNFAMKQVTSGFSWTHFAWSRDSKRAFIQLTQSRESNGLVDFEQRKKLDHDLDKTGHPLDDLPIWKYTYEFMACRESKHLNSRCDKCDLSPLRTTWITCLQCSKNEVDNTVNLCPSCVISSFVRLNESGKKDHTFQHNVVQFRTPLFRTYLQDMLDKAERITKRITEKALGPASSACVQCSAELVPPFWACLGCESENAFICWECNQRTEARRPWLLEHRLGDAASNNEDGSKMHEWWHTLVLFTQADAVSANSRLSLEDRFALLQRAFDIQSQQLEMERTTSRERHELLVSRIQRLESLRVDGQISSKLLVDN